MDYYKNYIGMYRNATENDKLISFNHWMNCHKTNVDNAAPELIIFSGQILKAIIDEQIAAATEKIKTEGYCYER